MKKRVLLFGVVRQIYDELKDSVTVLAFLDNDEAKWGGQLDGIPIIGNAASCRDMDFDEVIVCSGMGYDIIQQQLVDVGVERSKINKSFVETTVKARINFLHDYASLLKLDNDQTVVAEGGVFQGDFAKEINYCFPRNKLYLFDTFEGFDLRDINVEQRNSFSAENVGHLSYTSEDLVLSKLPYVEQAVIRKGYFPESAAGLEDLRFHFVNLDFDLYNPTLEGLKFFYPRLNKGCVLLLHDYFSNVYKGVRQAVSDYEVKYGSFVKIPIGDHCSLCIIKQ